MSAHKHYDYLVIGGSPSGCVVANELLTKDENCTVCIVEAGSANPNIHLHVNRAMRGISLGTSLYRWTYKNTPTKSYKRKVPLFAGKVLGGATVVNGMIWVRPSREDIEQCLGREFVAKYAMFEEIESRLQARYAVPHYYSKSVYDAFARDPRFEHVKSINGVDSLHFKVGRHSVTCRSDERRVSAYDAYIKPLMTEPRLSLLPNTTVDRLLIEGQDVVGAVASDGRQLYAKRKVILAAGGIQSPCVLMRSGYGPAKRLEKLGISVVADNEHVGQHMLDHPHFDLFWLIPEVCHVGDPDSFMNTHYAFTDRWLAQTTNNGSVCNFYEMLALKRYFPRMIKHAFRSLINRSIQACFGNLFHIGVSLSHPKSEGSVELAKSDAARNPITKLNYYDKAQDFENMQDGVRETFEIVKNLEFIERATPLFNMNRIAREIRQRTGTHWHYSCTARMGDVVDERFRVLGLNNLYIADVSALRQLPTVNTQSIAYFVGQMVADEILGNSAVPAIPENSSFSASQTSKAVQ